MTVYTAAQSATAVPFAESPMSRLQVSVVALIVLLSALDGCDVLSVTFVAPVLGHVWGIGKAQLGVVLSSGLAGMAAGCFFLAPSADKVGRRPILIACLSIMAIGMLLCASASNVSSLAVFRFLTGIGMGALVAVVNPLAAEFTNNRCKPLSIGVMSVGYPIGGAIGGSGAAVLLRHFDWSSVFLGSAIATVVCLVLTAIMLPESPAFLCTRDREDSLSRLNAIMRKCGQAPFNAMPRVPERRSHGLRAIFAPAAISLTIRMSIINFLYLMTVYFVWSWLPQIVVDAGFTPSTGATASAAANLGGIAGGLALGWIASRRGPEIPGAVAMAGLAGTLVIVTSVSANLPVLLALATAAGFFLVAGMAANYATLALRFPTPIRASASGFVIGVGRIASAVAPLLAGWLFQSGLSISQVGLWFSICAGCSAAALALPYGGARLPRAA